jgi:hypothetical protein
MPYYLAMKGQNKTPLGKQEQQLPSYHIIGVMCQLFQWKMKCHLYIMQKNDKDVVVQLKKTKL